MKLIGIVNAHKTVDSFAEKENIGVHLAYVMTKFVIATQNEFDFYTKEVRKLFDKYGEKMEDGNLAIKPENTDAFHADIEKLNNTEVDDPGIRFSLSEMTSELKVSMKQIYTIMDFIKDDGEKTKSKE